MIDRVRVGNVRATLGDSTCEIAEPGAPQSSPVPSQRPETDLERLQRGTLSLEVYLEARLGNAVQHLAPLLTTERLALVQDTLREQLASDPVLVALVRGVAEGPRAR